MRAVPCRFVAIASWVAAAGRRVSTNSAGQSSETTRESPQGRGRLGPEFVPVQGCEIGGLRLQTRLTQVRRGAAAIVPHWQALGCCRRRRAPAAPHDLCVQCLNYLTCLKLKLPPWGSDHWSVALWYRCLRPPITVSGLWVVGCISTRDHSSMRRN